MAEPIMVLVINLHSILYTFKPSLQSPRPEQIFSIVNLKLVPFQIAYFFKRKVLHNVSVLNSLY